MSGDAGRRVPSDEDEVWMAEAVAAGESVHGSTSPNPWVGAVVVPSSSEAPAAVGATTPPGGPHAEIVALDLAGDSARGATVYTTLEPCSHHGRTPPCVDALIAAGVRRVVIGLADPDSQVAGSGIAQLRASGISVDVGVGTSAVQRSLRPYLKHRRTGRPWVVLKLAATLDGRIAAPDGSSVWITGPEARADVHLLRAQSDAIVVGAGTVRADDPALTVRDRAARALVDARSDGSEGPRRIVLGGAQSGARAQPADSYSGDPEPLLEELGAGGVLQLLVEGGATVAGDFHRRALVDQYVLYLAPALMGGDDGRPMFAGSGAPTMADVFRTEIADLRRLGADVRIDLLADRQGLP